MCSYLLLHVAQRKSERKPRDATATESFTRKELLATRHVPVPLTAFDVYFDELTVRLVWLTQMVASWARVVLDDLIRAQQYTGDTTEQIV